jgi:hypothetical protein
MEDRNCIYKYSNRNMCFTIMAQDVHVSTQKGLTHNHNMIIA